MSEEWFDDAACNGMPTEVFFPEARGGGAHKAYDRARRICDQCPVQPECLRWAEIHKPQYGMFAGLTPWERNGGGSRAHAHGTIGFADVYGFDTRDLWLTPQPEFELWKESNLEGLYGARKRRREILDRVDAELAEERRAK